MGRDFPQRLRAHFAAAIVVATLLSGCANRDSVDVVSGKVTFQGKPVSGQIVLVSSDGKEVATILGAEGNFIFVNVPKGEAKVLVRARTAMLGKTDRSGNVRPPPVGAKMLAAASGGAIPPARYAKPNELKLVLVGGQQVQDFDLTP